MGSLSYQIFTAMQSAIAYGESKRSYRAQTGFAKLDKIFSHSEYESIEKTSKDFTSYLQDFRVKKVADITSDHVDGFLIKKSLTCNDNTLTKIKAHIESIGIFCEKKFGVNAANFSPSMKIVSGKENDVKVGRPMDKEVFADLVSRLEQSDSGADNRDARLLRFVRGTGLRIDEVCTQKVADCHPGERGRFGFGYVDVSNPKHGRPRRVHLHSAQAREAVKAAIDRASGDRLFTCKTKTMQNRISQHMDIYGLKQIGAHAVRKLYAQDFYNFFRSRHTKRETIQMTNEQLGHSASRDVSELKTYVVDIW